MAGSAAKSIPTATAPEDEILPIPNLIEIQLDSYNWFLETGLGELFASFSPVEDYTGNIALEFMDYTFYFCSAGCKKGFGEDVAKSVLALKIPDD